MQKQSSEQTPKPRRIWLLVYKFILISIAAHVIALLIFGGFIIFQRLQPEPVQFEAPVKLNRVEPKKRQYKMRIKEQQARASRPKLQPRLQSQRMSEVVLPVIDTKLTPVKTELSDLPGLSEGLGDGLGFGGGLGELTLFGYTGAAAGMNTQTAYGDWLNLQSGRGYDLKILLAEVPGGAFGCMLFYQIKEDDKFRVFTTKPLVEKEKELLSKVHPDVAAGLE